MIMIIIIILILTIIIIIIIIIIMIITIISIITISIIIYYLVNYLINASCGQSSRNKYNLSGAETLVFET